MPRMANDTSVKAHRPDLLAAMSEFVAPGVRGALSVRSALAPPLHRQDRVQLREGKSFISNAMLGPRCRTVPVNSWMYHGQNLYNRFTVIR